MKSALELAMERAEAALGDEKIALTEEQKKEIGELKKVYEAKWAEKEIAFKAQLEKLARQAHADPGACAEQRRALEEEMVRTRQQLFAERDAKIEAIRKGKKAN